MTDTIWNTGAPPRRGAYRCRAGTNVGWRYWFGDRWSSQCSQRNTAIEVGQGLHADRPRKSKFKIEWASKAPKRQVRDLTDKQIADACFGIYLSGHPGTQAYDLAIADAVLRAAGVRPPKEPT